jgi:hypothetical protein
MFQHREHAHGAGTNGAAASGLHAADDAAIVHSLDTPHIRWQVRFDPFPLLVAQPKQVPARMIPLR